MMFQRKIDGAMKCLREKTSPKDINKEYINGEFENHYDPKAEWDLEKNAEIEKEDILPLILSALIVFGPVMLILLLMIIWLM